MRGVGGAGIGLWLLLGIFPREIILIAWIPTNLTLTVFNWSELIGHLPIYGVLAVLLLWSPGAENRRLWFSGLREGPLAISESSSQTQGENHESDSSASVRRD